MKKSRTIIVTLTLLLLAVSAVTHAGDAGRESLFSVGAGARALGLGGGYVSLADDATAVYYNPAGLTELNYQQVSLMHMVLFEGTHYNFASYALPTTKLGTFGVAYMTITTGDIDRRSEFAKLYQFDYFTSQLMLSYSHRLQGPLSVGISGKLLTQELDTYSDNAIGLDFGLHTEITPNVSIGIVARDAIAPSLEIDGIDESVPTSIAGGVALTKYQLSETAKLSASFELEKFEERSTKIHTGAELVIDDQYAMRAGYDRENLALGLGYTYHQFQVDYAYKMLDELSDSHRFSLSFKFGPSLEERRQRAEEGKQPDQSTLLEQERQRQFNFYKEKADAFYNRYRLDSAVTYYQRALAFDEDNEEIIGTIAAIDHALTFQRQQEQRIAEMQRQRASAVGTYLEQARSFYEKQYFQAARDMLDLVFDIDPDNDPALELQNEINRAVDAEITRNLSIARVAEAGHLYLKAFEAYNRILELDPGNQEILTARRRVAAQLDLVQQREAAIKLFREGKLDESRRRFESVLSIEPSNAMAEEYIRKIDSALAKPPSLEDIQKDRATWQLYLDGLRHMRDRQYDKAIEAWEKVLKKYPNNPNTINNIEQARLRQKSEKGDD